MTGLSRSLTFIFFTAILLIDWLYILSSQQKAPLITHWVVTLPLIIPLFFSLTLLALIGIYLANPWGFVLAYFNIILSMFFCFISFDSLHPLQALDVLQFIVLIFTNIIVFFYIVYFNSRCLTK